MDKGCKRERRLVIRRFEQADQEAVVTLWHRCNLVVPWNDPRRDVKAKLAFQPELFLWASGMGGWSPRRPLKKSIFTTKDTENTKVYDTFESLKMLCALCVLVVSGFFSTLLGDGGL